jgi:ABC-type transport system involved in cytochrome c biogenesis permease subunit
MLNLTFNFTFGFYLAAFFAAVIAAVRKTEKAPVVTWCLGLGWVIHTAHIVMRWQAAGRPPMSNQYESMLFLAWASIGTYFVLAYYLKPLQQRLNLWAALAAALTLAGASLLDRSIQPLVPALQSNWLLFHVSSVMIGYAAFLLACVGGIALLTAKAPVDIFNYRAMALGFWLLTVGIVTGSVWANNVWGAYWSWDPKETWSLATWIFYGIVLHLRRTNNIKDRAFAWLCVAGFLFVLFTYFGVNYLMKSMHSYK